MNLQSWKQRSAWAFVVCLILAASIAVFGRGNGLETEVSKRADQWLYEHGWRTRSPLFGPFAKLSSDEVSELRAAKLRLRDATAYYAYAAWTEEGFGEWCGDMWRDGYHYALVVPSGATYGELLELDRKYRRSTQHVHDAYQTLCFDHSTHWLAELLFRAPAFGTSPRQIVNPTLRIKNLGATPINTVTINWEVGVLGRPGTVAAGQLSEEISGGLLKNEMHGFVVGFGQEERAALQKVRLRLGTVDLFILACIQSLDGRSNQQIGPPSDCLKSKKRLSEARLALMTAAPDITSLMAEPIMQSALRMSTKTHLEYLEQRPK